MAARTDNAASESRSRGDKIEGLTLETEHGITTVADSVVAKIAGHACREVDGIAGMGTNFRRLMGRVRPGEESFSQGVNVEVGKKEAAIDLVVIVRYGYAIPTLAQEVRNNVVTEIESGTGLVVKEVNIEIDDLAFEDEGGGTSARVE
ncbi:MAG: Asp23/Gls24 family envelope stress response protein [Acidimicrobiia bacterium]|nr:Asp23/Gls24 family envelope stress response protein [Acidimicrobiia bacterium]